MRDRAGNPYQLIGDLFNGHTPIARRVAIAIAEALQQQQ
jgi:hypothetical protein